VLSSASNDSVLVVGGFAGIDGILCGILSLGLSAGATFKLKFLTNDKKFFTI